MKRNLLSLFKTFGLAVCLVVTAPAAGQEKQSRTYTETFGVSPDAVVDIDISYADISFQTWDKNEVRVEATVTVEGLSPEMAKEFFDKRPVEILGSKSLVEVRTSNQGPVPPLAPLPPMAEIPEIPNIAPLFQELEIPELPPLPEIPPMPPVPMPNFDYDAYQKDGEAYLKMWKKEFEKNFDKDYREKMEAWSKEMAAGSEERRKHVEEWQKEHQKALEERQMHMEEMKQHQEEIRQMAREQEELARELAREVQRQVIINRRETGEGPTIFYHSAEGKEKHFKIRKSIKISMPKSAKLKMNVRHGEVKLAENTRDMQATLSYSSLLATTIDGDKTRIMASYSPVKVVNWNYGTLKADFSDRVALNEVRNLHLTANSSKVTIDQLLKSAYIENNLGELHIKSVADSFNTLELLVQNGEFICKSPASAYNLKLNGNTTQFTPPAFLKLNKSGDQRQVVYTGYHLNKDSNRSMVINSRYSEVTIEK